MVVWQNGCLTKWLLDELFVRRFGKLFFFGESVFQRIDPRLFQILADLTASGSAIKSFFKRRRQQNQTSNVCLQRKDLKANLGSQ